MAARTLPSAELLRQLFHYDPETGKLFWKNTFKETAPKTLCCGYRVVRINKILYLSHRVIWKLHYLSEPPEFIDHIDRNRINNKIENLRGATRTQNNINISFKNNNKSGVTGVNWHKATQKWRAFIGINKERKHIGLFSSFEDAVAARRNAEIKYHGNFRRVDNEL